MLDEDESPSSAGPEAHPAERRRRTTTPIPGPRSQALVDDLARFECPAITARRSRHPGETGVSVDPIVWRGGSGMFVEDVDGNCYLDFTSAFGVSLYGHAHPALVEALYEQAQRRRRPGAPSPHR